MLLTVFAIAVMLGVLGMPGHRSARFIEHVHENRTSEALAMVTAPKAPIFLKLFEDMMAGHRAKASMYRPSLSQFLSCERTVHVVFEGIEFKFSVGVFSIECGSIIEILGSRAEGF